MTDKLYYTWEQLHSDTLKICSLANDLGFVPDAVVGIVRGGATSAVIASHMFTVPCVMLDWSTRDHGKKDDMLLSRLYASAHYGKKYLIIDDIVDSGKTIKEIKDNIVTPKNVNNFLFTSLFFNPNQTNASINVWANIMDRSVDDRWVVFPFET